MVANLVYHVKPFMSRQAIICKGTEGMAPTIYAENKRIALSYCGAGAVAGIHEKSY